MIAVNMASRVLTMELRASEDARRGKPAGVKVPSVFTFAGNEDPTVSSTWNFTARLPEDDLDFYLEAVAAAGGERVSARRFDNRHDARRCIELMDMLLTASPLNQRLSVHFC